MQGEDVRLVKASKQKGSGFGGKKGGATEDVHVRKVKLTPPPNYRGQHVTQANKTISLARREKDFRTCISQTQAQIFRDGTRTRMGGKIISNEQKPQRGRFGSFDWCMKIFFHAVQIRRAERLCD